MSLKGPALRAHADGGACAKFNGVVYRFGRFDDREAHAKFASFKAAWFRAGRVVTPDVLRAGGKDPDRSRRRPPRAAGVAPTRAEPEAALSVAALADVYLESLCERHPPAWLENNLDRVTLSLRELRELYGAENAAEFDPLKLQAVRRQMLAGGRLNRESVNTRLRVVVDVFRFAVANALLPRDCRDLAHALAAVRPLRKGEYSARESKERGPVAWGHVAATLPHLPKPLRAAVEVLWHVGARPSEVLGLRPCDIDRDGEVWTASLARHKTASKGKKRTLVFGPAAQAALRPLLLSRPATRPLFSPREAFRNGNPQRSLNTVYDSSALRIAIGRAVDRENKLRAERRARGEDVQDVPRWTSYQLRHACASRLRAEHGLEVVRALLGHSSASMSEVYAAFDIEAAKKIARASG